MVTDFIVKVGIILMLYLEGDETHATENPPISPIVINFHRRYEILFADNFAIPEIGAAKNQAPILNAKG